MTPRPVYVILFFLALVCVMGLSESSAQRNKNPKTQQQATPAGSPTPAASPTPTPRPPPDKILKEIAEMIAGFSQGEQALPYECTSNLTYTNCDKTCSDCTLRWEFKRFGAMPPFGVARYEEKFSVDVKLSAINSKRVFVDGTQLEFETKNGRTVTVNTISPIARTDYTDAWQISIRSEDGARDVANLLKRVLNESCQK